MYRRHRSNREKIAFSFDSFLDVVANVIGIIIKLILVTWVGARSYSATMALLENDPAPTPSLSRPAPQISDDPLHGDIERNLTELAEARARLMAQLGQLETLEAATETSKERLAQLTRKREEIDLHRRSVDALLSDEGEKAQLAHLSVEELRKRGQDLLEQIKKIEKTPVQKQVLRYHTPVSRTVHSDEIFFECRGGRIAHIDLPAFMHEIQGGMEGVAVELRTRSKVERVTTQAGPFRVRYLYEKEGESGGGFRYGVTGWELEPLQADRGESLKAALAPHSDFRRQTDALDSSLTVVTFWVYPDSFELFRSLRDHLYERGIEVAARPLPDGAAIAGSRNGTKSRGQ